MSAKQLLLILLFPFLFFSCGKNGGVKVKELKLEEKIIQDQIWLDLKAKLDLGNTVLPGVGKLPIRLPKQGLVGEIEIGTDFINVGINLSKVTPLQTQISELPNGEKLPLIAENTVAVIPIRVGNGSLIKIYVSLVPGAKAIGVSIPITQLDSLGVQLKDPTTFFPGLLVGNVRVYPGLYTSPRSGENGLGLFVDLNNVFYKLMAQGQWYELTDNQNFELDYSPQIPEKAKERAIQKFVYKLHQRRQHLSVD